MSKKAQTILGAVDHAQAYDFITEVDGGIFRRDGIASSSHQAAWAALASIPDYQPLSGRSAPGLRLIGSTSTEAVRSALLDWTEGVAGASPTRSAVFWLPPDLPHWGRSVRFASLASALSEGNAAEDGTVLLARVDKSPDATGWWKRLYGPTDKLGPLFDRCLGVPRGAIPDALELIVKPGAWALALIHAPDPRTNYPCPFGYILAAPEIVAGYTYKLAELASRAGGPGSLLWQRTGENADGALAMIDLALGIEVA